jgi:hypothetical protein
MKKIAVLLLAASGVAPVLAAPNVGVSIGINQPGVYGRVDIGNVPQPPALVYAEPVIIAPPRVVVQRQPIYLYVPPGHQRNWRAYCGRYSACNQPVYFVQERWVRERWETDRRDRAPRGRWERDDRGHGHGRGHDRGHGRGHD